MMSRDSTLTRTHTICGSQHDWAQRWQNHFPVNTNEIIIYLYIHLSGVRTFLTAGDIFSLQRVPSLRSTEYMNLQQPFFIRVSNSGRVEICSAHNGWEKYYSWKRNFRRCAEAHVQCFHSSNTHVGYGPRIFAQSQIIRFFSLYFPYEFAVEWLRQNYNVELIRNVYRCNRAISDVDGN